MRRTKNCEKCGLPIDLCVCGEIEKEEGRLRVRKQRG